jgi:hypothetical protein
MKLPHLTSWVNLVENGAEISLRRVILNMACGAALEAAEELVRRKGRAPSAIAVVAAPDGRRALELLSPPCRPVPPEMWAALAASEQALFDDAAAGPLPAAAGKRPCALDASSSRAETRRRTGDDRQAQHDPCAAETQERGHARALAASGAHRPGHNCQPYRHAVSEASAQWSLGSQNSQWSGGEGARGCEEGGCSQEAESWLEQSFQREVTPVIPPQDPYLLNVEKWPPGIKFSKKSSL